VELTSENIDLLDERDAREVALDLGLKIQKNEEVNTLRERIKIATGMLQAEEKINPCTPEAVRAATKEQLVEWALLRGFKIRKNVSEDSLRIQLLKMVENETQLSLPILWNGWFGGLSRKPRYCGRGPLRKGRNIEPVPPAQKH